MNEPLPDLKQGLMQPLKSGAACTLREHAQAEAHLGGVHAGNDGNFQPANPMKVGGGREEELPPPVKGTLAAHVPFTCTTSIQCQVRPSHQLQGMPINPAKSGTRCV